MLDAVFGTAHVEHVGHEARRWPVRVARREAELDAVVGEHGVDAVGHGGDKSLEEGGCRDACCALDELDEGELRNAIDGNE